MRLKDYPRSYDALMQALAVLVPPEVDEVDVRMIPFAWPPRFAVALSRNQGETADGPGDVPRHLRREIPADEDDPDTVSRAVDAACGEMARRLTLPPPVLPGTPPDLAAIRGHGVPLDEFEPLLDAPAGSWGTFRGGYVYDAPEGGNLVGFIPPRPRVPEAMPGQLFVRRDSPGEVREVRPEDPGESP